MTTTTARPQVHEESRWRAVTARAVAHVAGVAWAGFLAGTVIGILSRLLMRISFLLRPDTAGELTQAGEVIGTFTLDGTVALVFFAGTSNGLLAAGAYLVAEPWLRTVGDTRGQGWRAAGVVGLSMALTGPLALTDELDFVILQPPLVHVVAFSLLPVIGGLLFWTLLRRRERRDPPPPTGRLRPVRWGLRTLGVLVFLPFLLGHPVALFSTRFAEPAVAALPFHLAAAVLTLVWWQRRAVDATPPTWLVRTGVACTAAVIVLGVGQFLRIAVEQL